jgi:hypothetical protein
MITLYATAFIFWVSTRFAYKTVAFYGKETNFNDVTIEYAEISTVTDAGSLQISVNAAIIIASVSVFS